MKLYYFDVLNPRKACAFARHIGAILDYEWIDLGQGEHQTAAFRAINPNAKLPVLDDDGRIIWEADAIMCHLARKTGSDLWPQDERQVDVVRWLTWNHIHFTRFAAVFYFENVIKTRFGAGPGDSAKTGAATKPLQTAARVLDGHLTDHDFLVGGQLSLADFAVAATLPYAQQAQLPLDSCPAIWRWHDRMNALPAWRDPFPSRRPTL